MKLLRISISATLGLVFLAFGTGCHHHSRGPKMPEASAMRSPSGYSPSANSNRGNDSSHLGSNDSGEDYYLALMTPDEVEILRSRAHASGRDNYQLTDFLSSQERANLRRRDSNRRP